MARHAQRHDFVVVIPVADRPLQLADCLDSLLEQRRRHAYSGEVAVLVVDDSLDAANRQRQRAVAEAMTHRGLPCHYLGQTAQRDLVEGLPASTRARLAGIVGDGVDYARKGASISRNIAYLWLNRLPKDGRARLFWFIDSDQEFRVNLDSDAGETLEYALDYFTALDRIFRDTPTRMLTGKVVGDPPVSPAVMAGNFLDDVLGFLAELAGLDPAAACTFHGAARPADDAAYHDMADLFGFKPGAAFRYRCPLAGAHDHADCLAEFAARLGRFFDGEHPTRRTYHVSEAAKSDSLPASLTPARTVYTGNYVITPAALEWFIPFAPLKLRMAGPTLGRLVRAGLGSAFVSANLPMLHKRTVGDSGASECRPGLERGAGHVDLSGEFERQYHGDVMLFSIERLCADGFPERDLTPAAIRASVVAVDAEMHARYLTRQATTEARIRVLETRLDDPGAWWRHDARAADALARLRRFAADLRHNFSAEAPAWALIEARRAARGQAIVAAIAAYRAECTTWREALLESRP